jgi:hypothetical protein
MVTKRKIQEKRSKTTTTSTTKEGEENNKRVSKLNIKQQLF